MRHQMPPLTDWQVAQIDAAKAYPFEAGHIQADLLAHAADLAFFNGEDSEKLAAMEASAF